MRARNADGSSSNRGLEASVNQTLRVPSPRAMDGSHGAVTRTDCVDRRVADGQANLAEYVLTQRVPTPCASEARQGFQDRSSSKKGTQESLTTIIQGGPEIEAGGSLNPDWVEWLMGWPIGWTRLEHLPAGVYADWAEKTVSGQWWLQEPDIPRVAVGVPDRAKRLKAIGNGQVPACAALAWSLLVGFE